MANPEKTKKLICELFSRVQHKAQAYTLDIIISMVPVSESSRISKICKIFIDVNILINIAEKVLNNITIRVNWKSHNISWELMLSFGATWSSNKCLNMNGFKCTFSS